MILRLPQEKKAFFSEVGRVGSRDRHVGRPQRESQEADVRVPRSPVLLAHALLVGVDRVQPPDHGGEGEVAESAVELSKVCVCACIIRGGRGERRRYQDKRWTISS